MARWATKNMFENNLPEGSPTAPFSFKAVDDILRSSSGSGWYNLEQEEVYLELEESEKMPEDDRKRHLFLNKVNALKTMYLSDGFFYDLDIFQKIVLAAANIDIEQDVFQDIDLVDVSRAVSALKNVKGVEWQDFGDSIVTYVAALASRDGMILLTPLLEFAQDFLDKLNCQCDLKKEVIKSRSNKKIEDLSTDSAEDLQALKYKRLVLSEKIAQ